MAIGMAYICQEDESPSLLISWFLGDDPEARDGKQEADDGQDDGILRKAAKTFSNRVHILIATVLSLQGVYANRHSCAETENPISKSVLVLVSLGHGIVSQCSGDPIE